MKKILIAVFICALATLTYADDVLDSKVATPVMDCDYKITSEEVNLALVKTWAQYSVAKAFELDAPTLNNQMESLKKCFTEKGYEGFTTALNKSGNLTAIENQQLSSTSKVDGDISVTLIKENQWKVSLPLEVVYQNEKQKLTQLLNVDVLISLQAGSFGIMQIIAAPRVAGA